LRLPAPELQERYQSEKAKESAELAVRLEREEEERFFNKPHATADFEHWSRQAYWTIEEGVALLFGKAPEVVSLKSLEPHRYISPFAIKFAKVHELARRASLIQEILPTNLPGFFLAWARRLQLEADPRICNAVEAVGVRIGDWKSLYDERSAAYDRLSTLHTDFQAAAELREQTWTTRIAELEARLQIAEEQAGEPAENADLGPRERSTLLKLTIGMAKAYYAYDPRQRGDAVNTITSDLHLQGISISDDTVRRWLKLASEAHFEI
jgi:hypothetical protein